MTTITLTTEDFQFLTAFVTMMIFAVTLFCALPSEANKENTAIARMQNALGATLWPAKWFVAMAVFWAALVLCLFGGLIATIGMIVHQLFFAEDFTANRFPLIQLAALTATLGAVVALPFTVMRLKLTQDQTETAKAALFNEKITEAASDLHAQRQVTKEHDGKLETVWEDDVVRRNAAIDRLEVLVREQPEEAARVSRLLSVYVRELSKAFPAKEPPNEEDVDTLKAWAGALEVPRSDLQNAVQVLGRLAKDDKVDKETLEIDLSEANLQAMSLSVLDFKNGDFREASCQGANLMGTDLTGASLEAAKLLGADLRFGTLGGANLSGAELVDAQLSSTDLSKSKLIGARLQRASLTFARLQGADLMGAELNQYTDLTGASLDAASVKYSDTTQAPYILSNLKDVFGDESTIVPFDIRPPSHWPQEDLGYFEYLTKWRAFAASKGVDIPD